VPSASAALAVTAISVRFIRSLSFVFSARLMLRFCNR
jgi:hypothetical protein